MSETNFIQLREKRKQKDNLIINVDEISSIYQIQKGYGNATNDYVEITMKNGDKYTVIGSLTDIKSLIGDNYE